MSPVCPTKLPLQPSSSSGSERAREVVPGVFRKGAGKKGVLSKPKQEERRGTREKKVGI